ncbi:hypothetical protein V9T40_013136 [Parthenolecanium corni]|uniref:Uncharacterized protein n=1 Tax=Parthenolecanium corni TaxID=536013 RepID=A0AAN9TKT1_9HEMI
MDTKLRSSRKDNSRNYNQFTKLLSARRLFGAKGFAEAEGGGRDESREEAQKAESTAEPLLRFPLRDEGAGENPSGN